MGQNVDKTIINNIRLGLFSWKLLKNVIETHQTSYFMISLLSKKLSRDINLIDNIVILAIIFSIDIPNNTKACDIYFTIRSFTGK